MSVPTVKTMALHEKFKTTLILDTYGKIVLSLMEIINHKQSTSGQHLSTLKASVFALDKTNYICLKCIILYLYWYLHLVGDRA